MNRFSNHRYGVILGMVVFIMTACTSPSGSSSSSQATLEAIAFQNTALALQITQAAQNQQPTTMPPSAGNQTIPTPRPTSLDDLRQNAKILLYEDIAQNTSGLERYVKRALDEAGYHYMDIKGDQNQLKSQILGNVQWDLIIISAEVNGKIPGDYFEYLVNHFQRGSALIIEMWDLDDILYGKIGMIPKVKWLMDTCGVELQSDWYSPEVRDVWALQPQHAVWSSPNRVGDLKNVGIIWRGDIGDLLKIKRVNNQVVGDAVFLVGLTPANNSLNGLLTTCVNGRLVLQTFDTHEYERAEMIKLWQNYVYHTLNNHFLNIIP
ncbi:MAG: hypothetical protein ACPL4H_02910 [Anaerolineales bacterium]